jgi:sensor histidine kinase YesM
MALGSSFGALAVPILQIAFGAEYSWPALFRQFWMSLIYAFCVGGVSSAVVPPLWCRSQGWAIALRWLARLVVVAAGSAAGCLLSGLCLLAIWRSNYSFWKSFVGSYKIAVVLSTFVVAFLVMYERHKKHVQITEKQLKEKELERERALKLATEARLSSLESRVHPHFLFNTINSVSSLIHDDPERAEQILNRMAGLLRFSLDSAQGGLVPLEREIKIVEDYLEIERARFGERLQYSIELPPHLRSVAVPPLSVQTLVENSVKYAVGARRRGASIVVSAKQESARLHLQVADDGPGFQCSDILAGHGLNNLEQRVAAIFGDSGKVTIESSSAGTSVTINLPVSLAKAA